MVTIEIFCAAISRCVHIGKQKTFDDVCVRYTSHPPSNLIHLFERVRKDRGGGSSSPLKLKTAPSCVIQGEAMKKSEVLHAWSSILKGRAPSLSIEITKECPLRCPGCYAFDAAHLGGSIELRQLSDFKGDELVTKILALIDEHKPLHVSLVGGDPLVRYRELELLLPQMESRGVHTQIVTSAFRIIPSGWKQYEKLNVVVSIDGLQPEHDARRKPATYERILKNIEGAKVTIHCTITSQIAERPGYLDEFLAFWSSRPEIAKIWFSIFTPQIGASDVEILTAKQRAAVIAELRQLRLKYPVLDMPAALIDEIAHPPKSPDKCIFAQTTETISADLKTKITPCQFGGKPDCEQCGCIASMALGAVGHHKVLGPLTAGHLFMASDQFGKAWRKLQRAFSPKPISHAETAPFKIL
jgi:MoaA/NifB/PqqE/SkfB family radical SAM enzyme